jgi:hypothetical protein
VHAVDLEAELRQVLTGTLLNPDYLRTSLAASVEAHDHADARRAETLAGIDKDLTKLRRDLDQLITDFLGVGPATKALIEARMQRIEKTIAALTAERAHVAAARPISGLNADAATALEAFAHQIGAGLAAMTSDDFRQLVGVLDLRAVVRDDAAGVKLGRRHRYAIDLTARIPLLSTKTLSKNTVT